MTIPETASKAACPKCGSDIRAGSVFCYNCGGRVAEEAAKNDGLEPTHKPFDQERERTRPAPGLKTAAELRRRSGVFDRKPRRIAWEPVTESSDIQLLIVTGLVLVFTVIVIALAFYLR